MSIIINKKKDGTYIKLPNRDYYIILKKGEVYTQRVAAVGTITGGRPKRVRYDKRDKILKEILEWIS